MPYRRYSSNCRDRGLAMPIAVALALKAAALTVLYLAFFVPPGAVGSAATAVLGLPR